MSRDSAKAHYAKQPGDPDEGFITASDAQAAIDDIYDDMSAPAVIADGSVTSGKIAADAVGSAQIATGAVGSGELATDAVTSDKIADGAVSNAHVASDAAIAASKIAGTALTTGGTGIFNAKDYSATGDDTADDTAELQSAITAAAAVAGTVLVPPGTYKISDALTVPAGVTITGTGTIHQVTSGKNGLTITGDDVTIEGITLLGRHATATYSSGEAAVQVAGASAAAYIHRVAVRDVTASLWGMYGVHMEYVTDFAVSGCRITDIGYAGVDALSSTHGLIADNRIDNIGPGTSSNMYGIALSRYNGADLGVHPRTTDVIVRGNTVSNVAWEGLDTHGGQRITFADNVVLGCQVGIAVVGSVGAPGVDTFAPKDVTVTGNVIDSQVTDGSLQAGISFVGSSGAISSDPATDYATGAIVGNVVRGHGTQDNAISGATYHRNTQGLVIAGNTFINSSPNAVFCYYDNRAMVIAHNTFVDVWSTSSSAPAVINLNDANNTGLIAGNVLRHDPGFTATHLAAYGVYNGGHAAGTDVNYGANDFVAATAWASDRAGIKTKLTAPLDSTEQIRAATGSESEPGFSFTAGPSTGFWGGASDRVRLAIGGDTKYIFYDTGLTLVDGVNLDFGGTNGSYLGVASSRKIGFWGATPKVQQVVAGARNNPEGALKDLLTKLANIGIISDTTTAS